MKKKSLISLPVLVICACTANLHAQNFALLKDINTSKDANPVNSINNLCLGFQDGNFYFHNPDNGAFAVQNGVAYFAANDGIHGTELWRSDSTAGGTYMVKDITPGSASSTIESITVAGNQLFFTANRILYKSNGTEAGTVAVPGITYNGDQTTCLTPAGNVLYFFTTISRLWRTDGTEAGTTLIKDFRATPNSADFLAQLTNVNGTVFFVSGLDNTYGSELWRSDGTTAGTVMVKDINPGNIGSRPSNLTAVEGKLYFSGDDGTGIRLWVSDGTADGTKAVVNNAGATLQQIENIGILDITPFTVVKKTLYFKAYTPVAGNELYKYDPAKAAAGVSLVKDIVPGVAGSDPSNLTAVDSTLYFSVTAAGGNQQLWKSNTNTGTKLIQDMGPGYASFFSGFISANGQLLFSFYTPGNGMELWSSDGKSSGTTLVKDIYAGDHSSFPSGITYLGNGISVFSANDGIKGTEIWRTNGKKSQTVMVKNVNNTTTSGSNPNLGISVSLNNNLYFAAYDPVYGNGLYISDGTPGGTHLIKDLNPGNSSNPLNFTVFKGNVYFSADNLGVTSVYKTDGTAAGTIQVFNTGKAKAIIRRIIAAQDYLYVFYNDLDSNHIQLWVSDGTTAGSHKIQDLDSSNNDFTGIANDNALYFSCFDPVHGLELWKATNEPGSAEILKDIYEGTTGSNPNQMVVFKNKVYFEAIDIDNNRHVYMSDGTRTGTKKLFENPTSESSLAVSAGKLFFGAYDGPTGNELYTSTGTTAGTKLLKDINAGANGSNPGHLFLMDSIMYFQANDGVHGTELWKSNGTAKGTVLVKDLAPGLGGSYPYQFTTAGGKLYFNAQNSSYQPTIYVSDGTSGGTKAVVDAGLQNVIFSSFIGGGSKLFINGYTYALGNELYAGANPGLAPQINNVVAGKLTNEKLKALILGNPVKDELKLVINSGKTQQAQIVLTDASGKVLLNKSESLYKGVNNVSCPSNTWASGIYNLKITAEDGSTILLKAVK